MIDVEASLSLARQVYTHLPGEHDSSLPRQNMIRTSTITPSLAMKLTNPIVAEGLGFPEDPQATFRVVISLGRRDGV